MSRVWSLCSLVTALNDIWTTLDLPRVQEARANNTHFVDFADPSVNCGYLPGVRFGGPQGAGSDGGFYSKLPFPARLLDDMQMSISA